MQRKKDNTDFVGRFVLLSSVGEQGAESLLRLMPYEKQGSSSPTDVCLYYKEFKQNLMYAEDSEDVIIPAIDPSGYLPMEYRFNLSLRVRIHRQWRKEQKAKQTDATEEEAKVLKAMENARIAVAKQFTCATLACSEMRVACMMSDKLFSATFLYEKYLRAKSRNSFCSPDSIFNSLAEIERIAAEILECPAHHAKYIEIKKRGEEAERQA